MCSEHIRREQQQLEEQQVINVETRVKASDECVDSLITITEAATTTTTTTTTTTITLNSIPAITNGVNTNGGIRWTDDTGYNVGNARDIDNNTRALDDNVITNRQVSVKSKSLHTNKKANQSGKLLKLISKKASVEAVSSINVPATSVIVLHKTSLTNNNTAAAISSSSWKFSRLISFQDNIIDVYHRKGRRLNGLQLPLHPLQLLGWTVLFFFGLATYWILIPSFRTDLQESLYGLIGGLYLVHIVSHLTALLIDPADRELRRLHRNDRIIPEFDRSKHAHVIENGRCHLCNIRTSSEGTKHCSVCNKCVGKFDHHCKWLNHCIGSRNYVAFLMCVVSAVCATLVILAAVIAQFVLYYTKPQWLSFWHNVDHYKMVESITEQRGEKMNSGEVFFGSNENSSANASIDFEINANFSDDITKEKGTQFFSLNDSTLSLLENVTALISEAVNEMVNQTNSTYELPLLILQNNTENRSLTTHNFTTISFVGLTLNHSIFWILIGCLGLLAAITAGLLLHLCFFHIYISFLGLTTYEYIRNHRQTQETKSKPLINANNINNGSFSEDESSNHHLPKKTNDCAEIYLCSSAHHPNNSANSKRHDESEVEICPVPLRRLKLHCCANSREYHQTASKTYYMCSLLEETSIKSPLQITRIAHSPTENLGVVSSEAETEENFKTYHCCSAFAATDSQRRASAAASKATLVSNLEYATDATPNLSTHRSFLHYAERCTFCTFRLRSPVIGKKDSKCSMHKSHNSGDANQRKEIKKTSSNLPTPNAGNPRCCMKSISKHQRWRRKWNCCVGVPDSPDVPNDLIAALTIKHQHEMSATKYNKTNVIPMHFENASSGSGATTELEDANKFGLSIIHSNSSVRGNNEKTRSHNTRTWPVARFRHMIRALHRYKRPRCQHQNFGNTALGVQPKQNQIRPLHLQTRSKHMDLCDGYYGSNSPQPLSSTTNASDASSEQSNVSNSSNLNTSSSQSSASFKTSILPTSVIRDETAVTYTTPVGIILPPALPPPVRRKIPNPADLDELTESLGFASHPSNNTSNNLTSIQRLPVMNNLYRRQRRKHFLRTRSPTLSPIHESGLSNPTSPQPYRHNINSCSSSPVIVNKFCSIRSSELSHKTSSNSSLRSDSSSSSSN